MDQERKSIRFTEVFSTTPSRNGDGPVQQQTTLSPDVPSSTVAPSRPPTTVEELKTTDTVADGASEAEEVQLSLALVLTMYVYMNYIFFDYLDM